MCVTSFAAKDDASRRSVAVGAWLRNWQPGATTAMVQRRRQNNSRGSTLPIGAAHDGRRREAPGDGCGLYGRRVTTRFVVQLHDATTLHFDFRIQDGNVLRSWAVPKGPSLDPRVRRLAVPVEDHEMAAGEFEGVHENHARGTGAVIIWDEGSAEVLRSEPGHLSFVLQGRKLNGGFALTRTGQRRWIFIKVRDEHARPGSDIVADQQASVRSGRTWQQVASADSA